MTTPTNPITGTALIFEGGGMRASYTAAVVTTLLEQGIDFDWVAGISAGSTNTVNYLSRDAGRAEHSFTDFPADPRFGGWGSFLRGQGLFNAEYIYEHTAAEDEALPFDFTTFWDNPAECRIGGFEADTGRTVYWGKEDLADRVALMKKVRASSTMPLIMPPVHLDGHVYVDGALGPSGGIPLDAAREAGFSRFFVVLTQERGYIKSPQKWSALFKAHFRRYPALVEALMDRHRRYNATREELFDLETIGSAYLFVPDRMTVGNSTRDAARLTASYLAGYAQAQAELPRWRDFLGI